MEMNSNTGFHHGAVPDSPFNHHVMMFQSGAINSSAGMMLPMGSSSGMNSMSGMVPAGNSGGTSTGGHLVDTGPGLKHDTGLAADWSTEEQSILEEGLVKYADEPSIMRYIKIAATLRDKTVRDVALRCRWMTRDNGKRRKSGEYYTGKKMRDRKEKMVDSSSMSSMPQAPLPNMAAYSFMMHHSKHSDRLSYEVSAMDGRARHLLDENAQLFSQITANLATFKIRDNIDLFCRTRNNITAILNDMREMPGIMSQMPPLPVSLNEELANTFLPSTAQLTSQTMMFIAPSGIHLKQEPRC
ncbi:uncharacterized protein LOC131243001 isoform X2 [Magnolia sinica]|uniref:uncharacterized protein LOC131243001 isoform X2 n=1 Tax=Magnolia sinica TaxID=86752 RepID=UPI0026586DC3|nr:uncharacterized protein LOC131243001 isoform X2 [Magnolia sinica]